MLEEEQKQLLKEKRLADERAFEFEILKLSCENHDIASWRQSDSILLRVDSKKVLSNQSRKIRILIKKKLHESIILFEIQMKLLKFRNVSSKTQCLNFKLPLSACRTIG